MADPLSVTAGLVGITAAGLHGVKLLYEDLQRFNDAPSKLQGLQRDVQSVEEALSSLKNVGKQDWEILGVSVAEHVVAAVESCTETCTWFRGKLKEWTRHSADQNLTLQDRVKIAFKRTEIDIMSEKLRDCNLTIIAVTGSATLHSSIRNLHLSEEVRSEIAETQQALQKAVTLKDDGISRMTEMSKKLEQGSGIDTRIDGTTYAELVRRLDKDCKVAEATKEMLKELLSRFQAENAGQESATSYDHSDNTTFGANNSGLQSKVIHGGVHGAHFGGR